MADEGQKMLIECPLTADNPKISVVIPTLPDNSHKEVVACLKAQTFDDFEVIVINDATLDICQARNTGIEAANGSIVALTDDDCRPGPDWLTNIASEFEIHPDLVCLEGRVEGGRNYEGTRKYVGCNLAFDRNAALTVGGFDSDFAGWRDDTEFGWRMERKTDGDCRYSNQMLMKHPELPRAVINDDLEAKLRTMYSDRYEKIIVPATKKEQINDWLWRNGVWEVVDAIRYRN